MNNARGDRFWDWSVEVYSRPGVEAALIGLQDRLGLDVNLLLFACWAAASGSGRLSREQWTKLISATAEWRMNVVEPLRAVRRYLKREVENGLSPTLREKVKALELEAEHAEQTAIAGMAGHAGPCVVSEPELAADMAANLESYVAAAGISLSGNELSVLVQLVCDGRRGR